MSISLTGKSSSRPLPKNSFRPTSSSVSSHPFCFFPVSFLLSLLYSFPCLRQPKRLHTLQVEEGQTVLVMSEPDLSEDMDGWTEWYKHITEAVERLKMELDREVLE